MAIEGSSMQPEVYYPSTTTSTSTHSSDMSYLHEETIAIDGYYEDIIAIDCEL